MVKQILAGLFAAACAFGANAQNAAPTTAITAPAANASFVAPATITLNASAADSNGTVSSVAFYRGTTLLGSDTTAPYSFNWANVAAGTYSVTSRATDNQGAVTISAPLTVTVNVNVAPSVSLTSPVVGASFVAPATVALSASAADNDGTITKVAFYRDATLIGSKTAAPYTLNWTNAPVGNYSLTATATDDKGAVKTSSAVAITVVANQLPSVSITKPASNAAFAAPGLIQLQANAADSDGTISKVAYYNGATLIGTTTVAPYTFNWSSVAIGSYVVIAKATDNKGGVQTSAAVNVTVKANTAPSVALTSPAANTLFAAPGVITLSATAADSDGTVTKVAFYSGTTLLGTDTVAPFAFTWSGAAVGSYSLTAKATDDKGLVTTSAAVTATVKANVAPTVSVTSPVSNAFYGPGTMTLSANAADSDGTVSQVAFYNGATLIGTDTSAPFTVAWPNVALGSYSVSARATDDKGLVTGSAAVAVVVKSIPVPTVSITVPANNATYIAPATLTFNASAAVNGDTISTVEYISGVNIIGTATAPPYTVTLNNIAPGSYAVVAKATGSLGGTATSGSINLQVLANAAPQVSLAANPSSASAPAAVTLTATATDSDGTIAKVEFYNGATLLTTVTQAPYAYSWGDVAAGTYSITAKAFDNLGLATMSAPAAVTVTAAVAPATSQVFYIFSDQIDTAREITNSAGVKVWQADPDPFGANLPDENPAGQGQFTYNQRFPGQYFDRETGLHYNYFRDYDPQTGRYVQSDPIGLDGGLNTYGYVGGNPLSYIDPLGLEKEINFSPLRDTWLWNAAVSAPDRPGIMDVYGHGSPNVMNDFSWFSKYGPKITGKDLADKLRAGGKWKPGMPVVLNSCSTGSPDGKFAQDVATHLQTDVYAPTLWLWFHENGVYGTYGKGGTAQNPTMDTKNPGAWIKFRPPAK